MKDLKILIKDVERDFLAGLLVGIKNGKLTKDEAKKAASEFVSHSYENYEELFMQLLFLSGTNKEARRVFSKYGPAYYEEKDFEELSRLRQYNSVLILGGGEGHGR